MSINEVVVSGNITKEPELRRTASGMAVLQFSIAVNDRRKNSQSGEWEDYANFVDCNMFGKRAESLSGILNKGMKVAVFGKLRQSRWKTKDGKNASKVEIVADELELMTKAGEKAESKPAEDDFVPFDLPF